MRMIECNSESILLLLLLLEHIAECSGSMPSDLSANKVADIAVVSATMACAFLLSLAAVIVTARSTQRAKRVGAPPINRLELRGVSCAVVPRFFSLRRGSPPPRRILDNLSISVRRGQLTAMRARPSPSPLLDSF